MKVVIIGSGNVATILGRKMSAAGHELLQVMSRHEAHARELAGTLDCAYTSQWNSLSREGEIYLLAVPDRVLENLDAGWNLDKKLVVHTAGSVSKEVLHVMSRNFGVLYPLQSLNRKNPELPDIPMLIDGNTSDDLALIQDFAKTISGQVHIAGDGERLKIHLAAVIINNFSNHLYTLAAAYCQKEGLDFKWLLPLASETVHRMALVDPSALQTGPAMRNDQATIRKHLDLLTRDPELNELYQFFSERIMRHHSTNDTR